MTNWNRDYQKKVIFPDSLEKKVREIRSLGQTIATINGSFDLLHAGHLQILYEASKQADVLIAALNSDDSIRRYKSLLRPIVPLESRMQMMAALGFVDYVTWFDETDPCEVLKKIEPDVHVNGAEYRGRCPEEAVVKKVHYVELIPGLSTSQIIDKVLKTSKKDPSCV